MLNLDAAALRDAVPRRLQAHPPARPAGRGGRRRPPRTSSRARTACRWRSTATARASASPSSAGMIFVDGVDIGDVADVALRDRRMLCADGIFVVVATISEQDGSSVADPEVIFRGVPFPDEAERAARRDPRRRSRARWTRAAKEEIREIDLLQKMLHDDLAAFVYDRLRAPADGAAGRRRGLDAGRRLRAGSPAARRPRDRRRTARRGSRDDEARAAVRGASARARTLAAVGLGDRADDRRGRGRTSRRGRPAADEALEHPLAQLGRDAGAVVLDDEHDVVAAPASTGRADRACRAACGWIAFSIRFSARRCSSSRAPSTTRRLGRRRSSSWLAGDRLELGRRVDDDLAEVGRLRAATLAAGVGAGEQQQVGDQAAHALRRAQRADRRPRRCSPSSSSASSSRFASTLVSGVRSSCEASATNCALAAQRRLGLRARRARAPASISSSVRASSATSSSAGGLGDAARRVARCARSRAPSRSARRSGASRGAPARAPASSASSVPPSTPRSRKKRTRRDRRVDVGDAAARTAT